MVSTADFPQADVLAQVGGVASAVASGQATDAEIEAFIGLDSGGRQGRYYRLAAEILGLVRNSNNRAVLTAVGEEYSTLSTQNARMDFLGRCLLETAVFKEALRYIRAHRPTGEQLWLWFKNFYPGASSTARRRDSTFVNYLDDAHLVGQVDGSLRVRRYEGAVIKDVTSVEVGLSGKPIEKDARRSPASVATGTIGYEVDAQLRERANLLHWQLVVAKSEFLVKRGFPSLENSLIDLYSRVNEDIIIYEMKSVSEDASNLPSQIRKAIAQLYEYRYVFQVPNARLCIVTNSIVRKSDLWIVDYLAKDRLIAHEWSEDFSSFQCHPNSRRLLDRFAP